MAAQMRGHLLCGTVLNGERLVRNYRKTLTWTAGAVFRICFPTSSVLSLKFVQQFDTWKSFEQQHSGTEVHLFGALYGPTEVAP